jgi:hypothetical protein
MRLEVRTGLPPHCDEADTLLRLIRSDLVGPACDFSRHPHIYVAPAVKVRAYKIPPSVIFPQALLSSRQNAKKNSKISRHIVYVGNV